MRGRGVGEGEGRRMRRREGIFQRNSLNPLVSKLSSKGSPYIAGRGRDYPSPYQGI
jgi:hypothetical protein